MGLKALSDMLFRDALSEYYFTNMSLFRISDSQKILSKY